MRSRRRYALLLALAGLAAAVHARTPTLVESLSRPQLGLTAVSPDGQQIAFLKRETDWKNNDYVWQLWLADGNATVQLTRGRKSVRAPAWSPDGRYIAFVTEREPNALEPPPGDKDGEEAADKKDSKEQKSEGGEKKPAHGQIWILRSSGGEAWQMSKSEADVEDFRWSKDGRFIVFRAPTPESKADKARKERYAEYRVINKDYVQNQLWRLDAAAALQSERPTAAELLTHDANLDIKDFAISPDAKYVAFSAGHDPLLAHLDDQDIYLLELGEHAAPKKIIALEGPDGHPMFSPDGKQLAFETALAQDNFFYANAHLALVDLAAVRAKPATSVKDVRDLTAAFDEIPMPVAWVPGGIYFRGLRDGVGLYRLDPNTAKFERLGPHDLVFDDVSLSADGSTLSWQGGDASHVSELFMSPAATLAPKRLTDQGALVRDFTLGSVETVTWKSKDGTLIEGVLHKPKDFDPQKRYPLLVKIHGGPTGISLPVFWPPDYAYPVQSFLAKGALVLEPNYRGSIGFGAKFRALNVRNLGVGDMWDIMSGVDALIAKGLADPNRLAAMGWSQGGYISAFLTTHTDRFKAISVGAGISDWTTYYVSTDITEFTPQYLKATPWDDPAIYAKTSPITAIKQAKTPTLIQHGSNDQRVPLPDAFELYRGLQDQHVESRLITYQGFGHGIDKPKSALALLKANLDWFDHYIWNEPIPEDSPLHGRSETAAAPE